METVRPALDQHSWETALHVLTVNPGSMVTTTGPQWIAHARAQALLEGAALSFLLRHDAGVILVSRMQTPGHLRIEIISGNDAEATASVLADALREVLEFLVASVEVARIDLTFGVYNDRLLQWAFDADGARFEGILSDSFFAAGEYWDGVIVSFTGPGLACYRPAAAADLRSHHSALAERLTQRITDNLANYSTGAMQ